MSYIDVRKLVKLKGLIRNDPFCFFTDNIVLIVEPIAQKPQHFD